MTRRALVFILLIGLAGTRAAFCQTPRIDYSRYLQLVAKQQGKSVNIPNNGTIYEGNLFNLQLSIKHQSEHDIFIRRRLNIEVSLIRDTRRLHYGSFKGIDALNANGLLLHWNELAQAGDRILIEYGDSNLLKYSVARVERLTLDSVLWSATKRNVFFANQEILVDGAYEGSGSRLIGFIRLENCRFTYLKRLGIQRKTTIHINSFSFSELTLNNCSGLDVKFGDCQFDKLTFAGISGTNLSFERAKWLQLDIRAETLTALGISESSLGLNPMAAASALPGYFNISGTIESLIIKNSLLYEQPVDQLLVLGGDIQRVEWANSKFNGHVIVNQLHVGKELTVRNLHFGKTVSVGNFDFPVASSDFNWKYLANGKLSYIPTGAAITVDSIYHGESPLELSNSDKFNMLVKSYQKFFNLYRDVGDSESANASYIEKKELESRRLAKVYQAEGGFRNLIRWQLSRLMKVYTNYGTDPAKAIVISVWVILTFAIFYFFFPSDWDATSKSTLIRNFKDFIEKNDKGYAKPLFIFLKGFVVSFLNAGTLSLNAFVTLGFGNIPTTGLARYACVLQGFIGWFLLSIFTVALINQVLT